MQCASLFGGFSLSFGASRANPTGKFVLPPLEFPAVTVKSVNKDNLEKLAVNLNVINYLTVGDVPHAHLPVITCS